MAGLVVVVAADDWSVAVEDDAAVEAGARQ